MDLNVKINPLTKGLIIFVIIVHVMFFVLEAIFWMQPMVHDPLLDLLNNPVTLSYPVQALTLRNLFVNQGFYNLFLVFAGVQGLLFTGKGKIIAGTILILFLCFAAAGAGIVLACSTKAYLLAFFQAVPAIICFLRVYPFYKTAIAAS